MSVQILELDNPILINNKEVKELSYDAQQITVDLFTAACAKAAENSKTKNFTPKVKETDYGLHLYLGMAAVIAVNPEIDFTNLERVKGFDLLDLTNIGTFFIVRKQAVVSEGSTSAEQSANTADTSTQASEK